MIICLPSFFNTNLKTSCKISVLPFSFTLLIRFGDDFNWISRRCINLRFLANNSAIVGFCKKIIYINMYLDIIYYRKLLRFDKIISTYTGLILTFWSLSMVNHKLLFKTKIRTLWSKTLKKYRGAAPASPLFHARGTTNLWPDVFTNMNKLGMRRNITQNA